MEWVVQMVVGGEVVVVEEKEEQHQVAMVAAPGTGVCAEAPRTTRATTRLG
jgi:hypothetical protein